VSPEQPDDLTLDGRLATADSADEVGNVSSQVWIGLVQVTPHPGNDIFGDAPGGFANVLAEASSFAEYNAKVIAALDEEGLTVVEIEDAEPLPERQTRFQVPENILAIADEAAERVVWDTFYVFESEDD
jgi:hypothetical protein